MPVWNALSTTTTTTKMTETENRDGSKVLDVLVIGAGVSGLSAAVRLSKYGQDVLVLEARDRVGGRTYSVQDKNHGTVDLGGAYFGPTQDRVFRVAKEFGLEFYNVYCKGKSIMDLKGNWQAFMGDVPPYWNPFKLLDLNHVLRTVDAMAKQVPLEAPWKAEQAEKWDAMTVLEFVDSISWTSGGKEVLETFIRSVLCVEMCEVSLLFVLWFIHSGGGIMRLASTERGAQEMKIKGGSQQLSDKMAEKLGDRVLLSKPIVHIQQSGNSITVTDIHGTKYHARYVISAIPLTLLNRISFEPPLPPERLQLIQRMPMGSIIKTNMFYKTPFWRELGYNGSASSSHGPVSHCFDDTKPDGSHAAIMGFILADRARALLLKTPEERRKALCEHYARAFKCDKFLDSSGYMEKNWMAEEYTGGCYFGTMGPQVITKYSKYLREPIGHVYFAGTETATVWSGYIDGAIQAGERAANEILYDLGKIEESEIWQEEPESQDFPHAEFPKDRLEWILPSNSGLLKFCVAALGGLTAWSLYWFLYGWGGKAIYYWLRWRYDIDVKSMSDLSALKNIF